MYRRNQMKAYEYGGRRAYSPPRLGHDRFNYRIPGINYDKPPRKIGPNPRPPGSSHEKEAPAYPPVDEKDTLSLNLNYEQTRTLRNTIRRKKQHDSHRWHVNSLEKEEDEDVHETVITEVTKLLDCAHNLGCSSDKSVYGSKRLVFIYF